MQNKENSKIFYIKKEASKDYPLIIFSVSYLRLFDYLIKIEKELKKEKFSGVVFFDLLGCNGDTSNRFFRQFLMEKIYLFLALPSLMILILASAAIK